MNLATKLIELHGSSFEWTHVKAVSACPMGLPWAHSKEDPWSSKSFVIMVIKWVSHRIDPILQLVFAATPQSVSKRIVLYGAILLKSGSGASFGQSRRTRWSYGPEGVAGGPKWLCY